jgi:hypothetical protein
MLSPDDPHDRVEIGWVAVGLPILGLVCLAGAVLAGWPLALALKGFLPPEGVLGVVVPGVLLGGGLLWYAGARAMGAMLDRRAEGRRLARLHELEGRPALTGEQFTGLFEAQFAAAAACIRAEFGRFIGREDVAGRLLPADSVVDVCALAGVPRDEIDWAEFVFGLEQRFGVALWQHLPVPGTIADLVEAWASGRGPAIEAGGPPVL